ncbi:MAG: hypothetical protein EOP87_02265 [Verrucomicrobiaceae bacterium]|nr:MAG: hypothetical protein EOP87_02265 [Verrucomicrobiaceae bacterium]
MKFLPGLLPLLFVAGCALKHPIDVRDETDEIRVARMSKLSLATVQQIADARGGKEDGEVWHVDRHKGDVRIRKSRDGSNPDDDMELWFRDADGSWMQR